MFALPMLIVDKNRIASSAHDTFFHVSYLRMIYNTSRLTMFGRSNFGGLLYRRAYLLLLPASWFLVWRSGLLARFRSRNLTTADRLALFSALFFIVTLFAPIKVNGSGNFSVRLWLPCWMLATAAAASAVAKLQVDLYCAAVAVLLAAMSLVYAEGTLRPIARMESELENAPLPNGQRGLLIHTESTSDAGSTGAQYPLFWWSGARAFAAHRDVMLNSAWLHLTILPIKENGSSGLIRDYTEEIATEDPNLLAEYLVAHPAERARALNEADFVVLMDPTGSDPGNLVRFLFAADLPHWRCETRDYFSICTKLPAPSSQPR